MEVKEVIEFLEIDIKCLNREIEYCNPNDDIDAQVIIANKKGIGKYKQVISLLKQGEAYRQMWEALDDKYGAYTVHECYKGYLSISNLLADFKQKYLKEANPDEADNR